MKTKDILWVVVPLILLSVGSAITLLSVIKIICVASTASKTAVIGTSDFAISLLIAIDTCGFAFYSCIFGILIILTSLILIFLSKIRSKKR